MNHRTTIALIILFTLVTNYSALCQNSINESDTPFNKAIAYYQNVVGANSFIYTGKEYIGYDISIEGDPYFKWDSLQKGDIYYDGNLYKDVPMLYDIVKQVVVIDRYQANPRISLLNEKIKYFTLNGHRFVNERAENGNAFFDILSDGRVGVWVKRVKTIRKPMHAENPDFFKETDEIYIKKGDALYPVSNRNSVLLVFNDKRRQVKTFIRKKRLRFKKHIEPDLVQTVSFYSTLQ
jgi:hypothetical protein